MAQNLSVAVGQLFFAGTVPLKITRLEGKRARIQSLNPDVHLTLGKPVVHVDITTAAGKKSLTLPLAED